MAAPLQTPWPAASVLGDVLQGGAGESRDLLRQRVIVHLLRQVPAEPAALCVAVAQLLQDGVITRDVFPELRDLKPLVDCAGGCVERSVSSGELEALQLWRGTGTGSATAKTSPPSLSTSRFERDFERLELLGQGAFGKVWRCRHRLDGREYAVKAVQYRTSGAMDGSHIERQVLREAQTLAGLAHTNVVRYHTAWVEADWAPAPVADGLGLGVRPRFAAPPARLEWVSPPSSPSFSALTEDASEDGGVIFQDNSDDDETAVDEHSDVSATPAANAPKVILEKAGPSMELMPFRRGIAHKPAAEHLGGSVVERRATLYIQTELCSTDTLQTWIARRNAGVVSANEAGGDASTEEEHWSREAGEIFHQCAAALAALHSASYAHRDVKPSNIFFSSDKEGRVLLGDFGLAKAADALLPLPDTDSVVSAGAASIGQTLATPSATAAAVAPSLHTVGVGTPQYISPEQLVGGSYGVETDVFSLGVVLAELFCPVNTQMERAALLEGLRHHRRLPATLLATFPEVARLVLAMTAPDPASRPKACELVLVDLERQPASSPPGSDVGVKTVEAQATQGLVQATLAVEPRVRPQAQFAQTYPQPDPQPQHQPDQQQERQQQSQHLEQLRVEQVEQHGLRQIEQLQLQNLEQHKSELQLQQENLCEDGSQGPPPAQNKISRAAVRGEQVDALEQPFGLPICEEQQSFHERGPEPGHPLRVGPLRGFVFLALCSLGGRGLAFNRQLQRHLQQWQPSPAAVAFTRAPEVSDAKPQERAASSSGVGSGGQSARRRRPRRRRRRGAGTTTAAAGGLAAVAGASVADDQWQQRGVATSEVTFMMLLLSATSSAS